MPPRPTLPITWGGGLDRATGIAAVRPASFADLRNVELLDGTALVRQGLGFAMESLTLGGGATPESDVPALGMAWSDVPPSRYALGWYAPTFKLELFVNGTFASTIATLAGVPSSLQWFVADLYRKLFIAHDQPDVATRMQTAYRDLLAGTTTNLTADLDGAGVAPVYFRGVARYLNYLVGWGFGTASDQSRPDIVRLSLPGQPTVFNKEHYFSAGGGAVLNCVPVAGRLLVFKENEIRPIVGTNRANFGILPAVEPSYGLAGSRLVAVTSTGDCYYWNQHGPRMTQGGPSVNVALPLNLDAPQPSDLVATGSVPTGFAVYVPGKELVKFVFGQRAYVLHLRNGDPRWTYDEYAVGVRSAGIYDRTLGGGNLPGQPRYRVMYGRSGGNKVLAQELEKDDGVDFQARGTSDPVAPAGPDGECCFYTLWLAVTHTMACTLRVTPIVDGVVFGTMDVPLSAKVSRTTEVVELGLKNPLGAAGVTALRGTWFQAKVETLVAGLPAIGTGDLLFDLSSLEYTIERETRAAAG